MAVAGRRSVRRSRLLSFPRPPCRCSPPLCFAGLLSQSSPLCQAQDEAARLCSGGVTAQVREKCMNYVLCCDADFYVRREFAGHLGVPACCPVVDSKQPKGATPLATPPCLDRHGSTDARTTPRIARQWQCRGVPFRTRSPICSPRESQMSNFMVIHAKRGDAAAARRGQRTGRGTDKTTTALVLRTMIVDAAPVGPFGGLSYRFCGFAARLQATVPVARLSWDPRLRKPRSSSQAQGPAGSEQRLSCDLRTSTAAFMNTK